jgi:hypothetical protein
MSDTNTKAILARLEKIEQQLAHTQAAAAGLGGHSIQTGTTTLVNGQVVVAGVVLTAASRIFASFKDAHSGANVDTAKLQMPAAGRNIGAGSFTINALTITDALNNTDVSTVDWLVID